MISQEKIEEILKIARNEEVIGDFEKLSKSGKDLICKCPNCGKTGKGKGLLVSPAKSFYKCFICDWGGKNPVKYLCEIKGMKYPEALKYMADKYNISIEEIKKGPQKKEKTKQKTFRDLQLEQSGLTDEDQKAVVKIDDNTEKIVDLFESGTRNEYYQLVDGDDMIIWYYDLEGMPMMYQKKGGKMERLYRIRWQNPDLHLDQHGKPIKYQSPAGSGSPLFIPPSVRKAYQEGRVIKRLFIQEGEKKSIKACKHGIFSVGIMGIQNIAHQGKLPYELQLIIKTCRVEEVVFLVDSDWDHLNNTLRPGMKVDMRPWNFFHAVKNYRDYFKTFTNLGIYLQIYFGHLETDEKGIDDLLNGSLRDKENNLFKDIEAAINEKDGQGEYVHLYNISTTPDLKLMELWSLHSAQEFANRYKSQLINLSEFMIGKHKWRFINEEGKAVDGKLIEPTQPLESDEMYWEKVIKKGKEDDFVTYRFSYMYLYNFLQRRGFGRFKLNNSQLIFIKKQNNIVETIEPMLIRDYVTEFTYEICPKEEKKDVMDMLYRGGKMYLGPDSLSNLKFMDVNVEPIKKDYKVLYFKDKYWKISAKGVEERPLSDMSGEVWREKIIDFDANYLGDDFIKLTKFDEEFLNKNKKYIESQGLRTEDFAAISHWFFVQFSEDAKRCHFLQFLLNTSDFYWDKELQKDHKPKERQEARTLQEMYEKYQHFLSKLTGMAFLIHKFRNKSCERMVIGMDGRNSEVGDSNGRTGKSLLGVAIGEVIPQVYISAKNKNLTDDPFLFEEVTEKHDNIFLDDARANIDFEFFFPAITGKLTVNGKGTKKTTLSAEQTPFFYMTTNHGINGFTSSFKDRQFLLAFSDFYSDTWKPINDFGMNFFEEWDREQRNLFYNLVAHSLIIYFRTMENNWGLTGSGLIPAPVERLELRQMRQFIGETFLLWADEFYGVTETETGLQIQSPSIDEAVERKTLYDDFMNPLPISDKKYYTPQNFKKRFKVWCKYRGLYFNKHKLDKDGIPGGDDKRDSKEYFTVSKA